MWKCDGGDELVKYENLHAPGANITKACISLDNNRYTFVFVCQKASNVVNKSWNLFFNKAGIIKPVFMCKINSLQLLVYVFSQII